MLLDEADKTLSEVTAVSDLAREVAQEFGQLADKFDRAAALNDRVSEASQKLTCVILGAKAERPYIVELQSAFESSKNVCSETGVAIERATQTALGFRNVAVKAQRSAESAEAVAFGAQTTVRLLRAALEKEEAALTPALARMDSPRQNERTDALDGYDPESPIPRSRGVAGPPSHVTRPPRPTPADSPFPGTSRAQDSPVEGSSGPVDAPVLRPHEDDGFVNEPRRDEDDGFLEEPAVHQDEELSFEPRRDVADHEEPRRSPGWRDRSPLRDERGADEREPRGRERGRRQEGGDRPRREPRPRRTLTSYEKQWQPAAMVRLWRRTAEVGEPVQVDR